MKLHFAHAGGDKLQDGRSIRALIADTASNNSLYSYAYQSKKQEQLWSAAWEMKLHLTDTTAKLNGNFNIKSLLPKEQKRDHLFSFAYQNQEPQWSDARHQTIAEHQDTTKLYPRVLIDSGAFTAWSSGKTINPKDYLEWALDFDKRWRHKMSSLRYINLDYIPARKGVSATPEQLKEAVEKSMQNADFLRLSGLSPVIEVFHQDEPLEILKKLEDRRNGGCIALSPRNDVSIQKREKWLYDVTKYCVRTFGRNGFPPAHGLAVTNETLLKAYPFYSCDSSSWVSCLRFGGGAAAGFKNIPRYKDSDAAMAATIHTLRAEIRKYKKMESDMTKLWKIRGIEWDESTVR